MHAWEHRRRRRHRRQSLLLGRTSRQDPRTGRRLGPRGRRGTHLAGTIMWLRTPPSAQRPRTAGQSREHGPPPRPCECDGFMPATGAQEVHRTCEHSGLLQHTRETAWTGAADHSTLDGLEGTTDTRTGGLKPLCSKGRVGSNPTPGTTSQSAVGQCEGSVAGGHVWIDPVGATPLQLKMPPKMTIHRRSLASYRSVRPLTLLSRTRIRDASTMACSTDGTASSNAKNSRGVAA